MSAAAVGAAGYLFASGRLTSVSDRHPTAQGEPGRVCPHCNERFDLSAFEFHLFIAHKRTEAKP